MRSRLSLCCQVQLFRLFITMLKIKWSLNQKSIPSLRKLWHFQRGKWSMLIVFLIKYQWQGSLALCQQFTEVLNSHMETLFPLLIKIQAMNLLSGSVDDALLKYAIKVKPTTNGSEPALICKIPTAAQEIVVTEPSWKQSWTSNSK